MKDVEEKGEETEEQYREEKTQMSVQFLINTVKHINRALKINEKYQKLLKTNKNLSKILSCWVTYLSVGSVSRARAQPSSQKDHELPKTHKLGQISHWYQLNDSMLIAHKKSSWFLDKIDIGDSSGDNNKKKKKEIKDKRKKKK